MPIFDLIWVFMNSGCVLGNIEQKIFIKKITEADQLNFKVSLVRPKLSGDLLVFIKSQSGFFCLGGLHPGRIQRLQRSLQGNLGPVNKAVNE